MSSPELQTPSRSTRAVWTRRRTRSSPTPSAQRHWASAEIRWGVFGVPESQVGVPRRRRRPRRRRARLRHGVLLRVARAARRAAGRRRPDAGAARDRAAHAGARPGIEFPLVEAPAKTVPLPGRVVRPRALGVRRVALGRSRTSGSPRRRGCCAPAGGSSSCTNSMLVDPLRPRRGPTSAEQLAAPAVRHVPRRSGRGDVGIEFHLSHGDWIRLLRANGFEIEDAARAAGRAPDAGDARATTTTSRSSGRSSGRRGDLGQRASSGERAAGAAAPARVDVAAAARDPRAARHSVRRRRAALRGARSAGRGRRRNSCASTRSERRGRSRPTRTTGRCSASTRRSSSTGASTQSPRTRATPSGCSRSSRAARTRSCRGSALVTPGWEYVEDAATLVTFRALTPRDLARYVASGEWEGRAGGYAIQGLGAALVERVEGDYLNVVGLPASLLVRLLAERFAGTYGFG